MLIRRRSRRCGRKTMRKATVQGVAGAAVGAAAIGTAAVAIYLADELRRHRLERSVRVWRLTARRGLHFAWVKARGVAANEARRAELDEHFAIRTAEDVAAELGNMKGAIMKAGQMISFIAEGLPEEAREALATLQADVEPMAPSLAEQVVRDELGDEPDRIFLDWDPIPVAAASIGQVHKCVLRDGREVAVKIQYPGVDRAIKSDLDNAEMLYGMFTAFALKGMDVKPIVDELRERMGEELDYRVEARCQTEFVERYRGHPFIRIPAIIDELSTQRVLTSEWVEGMTFSEFDRHGSYEAKQHAAEIIFRFAQCSIMRHGVFNGDPHPGNYRFHHDGSVTFLDFGLVKRWSQGELEALAPILDAIVSERPDATIAGMVEAGFVRRDHGLGAREAWDYVSSPYRAYIPETFTFTPEYVADALGTYLDLYGPHHDVIEQLNMPPSFVILDRVVWGVSAILGRLGGTNRWGDILREYLRGSAPSTLLGEIEADWERQRSEA